MDSIITKGMTVRDFKKQLIKEAYNQGVEYPLQLDRYTTASRTLLCSGHRLFLCSGHCLSVVFRTQFIMFVVFRTLVVFVYFCFEQGCPSHTPPLSQILTHPLSLPRLRLRKKTWRTASTVFLDDQIFEKDIHVFANFEIYVEPLEGTLQCFSTCATNYHACIMIMPAH